MRWATCRRQPGVANVDEKSRCLGPSRSVPGRLWPRCAATALALLALTGAVSLHAADVTATPAAPTQNLDPDAVSALHQLRTFATTGRVLHIGAHPDDENTQLIAYLSRGRGYDTAYLSITRGDGGQNLLGPQFDEKLGVARTQELLAARRIDGGRQFFTRAIDFGFSKNPEETLSIWNHQEVLGDVVRVIREFRPDVIVTRFPIPPGSGGHGHHTASAILAVEAFKLAGDPTAYPEQIREGLSPWQPKRIVWNSWSAFMRSGGLDRNPTIKVDIGGADPVTGESFASIAGRSRAMHKTQGFGNFTRRPGPETETFVLFGGDAPTHDLMDGVDTTWKRVPGGAELEPLIQAAITQFKPDDPAASVPLLLTIRRRLATLPASYIVADKRAQLDRVLEHCLGLKVQSVTATTGAIAGQSLDVTLRAQATSPVPLTWLGVQTPAGRQRISAPMPEGTVVVRPLAYAVPAHAPITQPYWLQLPPTTGMYQVREPSLIGRPENPPDLPVTYEFQIDGQTLSIADALAYETTQQGKTVRQPVPIVPPASLAFTSGTVTIFRPGVTREVVVTVTANEPNVSGSLALQAPTGWKASAAQPIAIAATGATATRTFSVTAPVEPSVATLSAVVTVGGVACATVAEAIGYPHIPRQVLQPAAHDKLVSVDVAIRGHRIGYLPGAGDDIPDALRQMGYDVTSLTTADLDPAKLQAFDAVVIGVRALNTRDDIASHMAALFSYVENGGTVVCQYNWARNLKTDQVAPYPLKLSDSRVTDEKAPVTFLAPDHPVLNSPNRITPSDFDGWVQDRGLYYPNEWDEHFIPILSMSDPGEAPLHGGLLVAHYGKGYYVYTGLAFYRQLPDGVPGAYRLFANLVSLGK